MSEYLAWIHASLDLHADTERPSSGHFLNSRRQDNIKSRYVDSCPKWAIQSVWIPGVVPSWGGTCSWARIGVLTSKQKCVRNIRQFFGKTSDLASLVACVCGCVCVCVFFFSFVCFFGRSDHRPEAVFCWGGEVWSSGARQFRARCAVPSLFLRSGCYLVCSERHVNKAKCFGFFGPSSFFGSRSLLMYSVLLS